MSLAAGFLTLLFSNSAQYTTMAWTRASRGGSTLAHMGAAAPRPKTKISYCYQIFTSYAHPRPNTMHPQPNYASPRPTLPQPLLIQVITQKTRGRGAGESFRLPSSVRLLLRPLSASRCFPWHFNSPLIEERNGGISSPAAGRDNRSGAARACVLQPCRLIAAWPHPLQTFPCILQHLVDHKVRQGPSKFLSVVSIPFQLGIQFYFN